MIDFISFKIGLAFKINEIIYYHDGKFALNLGYRYSAKMYNQINGTYFMKEI